MKEMWSSAWSWPDDPNRLSGLGWSLGLPWGGIFAASHGGQDEGFRSFIYLAPARDVGIVRDHDQGHPVRVESLQQRSDSEGKDPLQE